MILLIEVVGLVLVAVALRSLVGGDARPPLGLALGAIAVVVAGIAFWGGVWSSGKELLDTHDANGRFNQIEANIVGGYIVHADQGVLDLAAAHMPAGARVYLECGRPSSCAGGRNEWATYRLLTHLFVASPRAADYVLFYYVNPRRFAYARGWRILRLGRHGRLGVVPK